MSAALSRATDARHLSSVAAARHPGPEEEWAALAPLLAARGRVRISRDGGRNYRARDERPVPHVLPNQPAAVLVYDHDGCAPVVCLDLDSARGDTATDHRRLTDLLDDLGAPWFSDTSPNGGRHLYVPLAEAAPLHEVSEVVRGLTALAPTLDPQPMLNIHAGCIRPPGSRHKTGQHQRLDQPIAAAVDRLRAPARPEVWRAMRTYASRLAGAPANDGAVRAQVAPPTGSVTRIDALHGHTAPDATFEQIARTGQWDPQRYRSASEARQAVLWASVASGWAFVDVARRVSDGTWPGLASLYARYRVNHRHQALARDWQRAVAFEGARRSRRSADDRDAGLVHSRTTSPHQSQRGAAGERIREWLAAVDLLTRRGDPAERAVLHALAEAGTLRGTTEVEHGNRSLSIATGLDQSTVGRVLRRLRSAPRDRLLIDLVRHGEGVRANVYALVIPDLMRPACESKPWRRGRIHAIRPAFRELGLGAAFVYDVLERAREPLSGRQIAVEAGLGHSGAHGILAVLASWGLAVRSPHRGWVVGSASLERLAEQWGVSEAVQAQIERYRHERRAWWAYLGLVDRLAPEGDGGEAPDDIGATILDWPRQINEDDPSPPTGPAPGHQMGMSDLAQTLRQRDAVRTRDALLLLAEVLGAREVDDLGQVAARRS